MADENGSSVKFTPDTKEESIPPASIEEGIPQAKRNGSSLIQRQTSSRLSAVSKKYDVDGDGKLDEAEQAMRDMDKEGRGYLTNDKVVSIFQEQHRMQKQLLLAKRLLIFFAALLVILAVANIGVAFAAARLAKDTMTQNNVLVIKDTGEVVATNNHADVYGIKTSVDNERRAQVTGDGLTTESSTTVSQADADAMYVECAKEGVSVKLSRTWEGYDGLENVIELCPGMSYNQIENSGKYVYVLMSGGRIADNKVITVDCTGNADPCTVSGNGLLQTVGEPCVFDTDCVSGSICHGETTSTFGTCKLPLGSECWTSSECSTEYCHSSLAYGSAGTCTCNPTTDAGCVAPKTCASSDDLSTARGISDLSPGCFSPVLLGSSCSGDSECLTGACDSSVCVCNSFSNFPCASGEACVNGTCQVSTGMGGSCPSVPESSLCFAVDEPVKCGECCYSNQCKASTANSSFDDASCAAVTSPDSECPDGYDYIS